MEILEQVKEKLGERIINIFEKNKRRYYIDIDPKDIVECADIMFKGIGCRFSIATGTDISKGIEILYHFSHDKTGKIFSLRVLLTDKKKPEIDSIAKITRGAEWIEREMWEMLGVNFKNHPDLRRLLLASDWPEGVYPLRKK